MKLLFDQNISYRVVKKLFEIFPDSMHVKQLNLSGKADKEIWSFAKQNNYAIVTFDSDFFELASLYSHPPKIIWLRTGNTKKENLTLLLLEKKEIIEEFLNNAQYEDISCIEIW